MYLGSWKIDDLLTFTVNTHTTAGVATDADSAPSYRVYEDETATPLLTGTMATLDAANTDGHYSEQITLSAANGFEKGKCYAIRIQATVSGVTGATVRNFQIEAEVDANTVSGTAPANVVQISGDSTAADNLEAAADGTGYNLGGGSVVAASVTGAVGSVAGNVGGNVAGSVGSVTGAVGSVAAAVTVGTNNDKTGYALSAAGVTAAQAGLATAASLATVATSASNAASSAATAATQATNAATDALLAREILEGDWVTDPATFRTTVYRKGTDVVLVAAKQCKDIGGAAVAAVTTPVASMVQA